MPASQAWFDLAHYGNRVSIVCQGRPGIAAGDVQAQAFWLVNAQPFDYFICIQPAEIHQIGEFVQHDQLVLIGATNGLRFLPATNCPSSCFIEIFAGPGEAVAGPSRN